MDKQTANQQMELNQRIEKAQLRIAELEKELQLLDVQIDGMMAKRQQYFLLSDISDRLFKLNKMGGCTLFWGEDCTPAQAEKQIQDIQQEINNYEEQLEALQQKKEQHKDHIQSVLAQINILNEEILILHERAHERQHEFVVEREMTIHPHTPMNLPWTREDEDETRFRRILIIVLFASLILGYLIPLWNIPLPDRNEPIVIPERLAKLLVKKEPPPPPPKVEKLQKQKDQPKKPRKDVPKPKTEKAKLARKKAERSGLLAFKDNFADLIDSAAEEKLGSQARISSKGQKARKVQRSIVTAQVEGTSGGINTASLSRDVSGAGNGIKGVEFSHVETSIGSEFFGEDRPLSDGPGPSRTDEEIQIVFDRYKAALYRIYNRELRKNPGLQGKLVLRLTIQPDGSVSAASIESSDMDAKALESKIVARVKRFNFGAKESVPAITILYPIDFLPAS